MTPYEQATITRRALLQRAGAMGLLVVGASSLLMACGDDASSEGSSGTGGVTPATITLAGAATPQTIDCEVANILESWTSAQNVYERLVGFRFPENPVDTNVRPAQLQPLEYEGRLAESWEFSNDGKRCTFTLRKGVKSAAGNELTSADVKFSFDRGDTVGGLRAFIMSVGGFSAKNVKVVDDYTFTIDTTSPLLLAALEVFPSGILDSTEVKKHQSADDPHASTWLGRNAAGFGRYTVTEFSSGQQVVFEAVEGHPLGVPPAKRIVYREVPESSNRVSLLSQGSVEIAEGLSPRELQQVPKQVAYPANRMVRAYFNTSKPPFDDKNLRKAMAYATPYQQIIDTVYQGQATQLRGPVVDTYPDYFGGDFIQYTTDPAEAEKYLAAAGLEGGIEVELVYNIAHPLVDEVAIQLKTAWDAAGITTKISSMDPSTFGTGKLNRSIPLFLDVDQANIPDTGYVTSLWFQSDSPINYGGYDNPEIDELIRQSLSSFDPAERTEIHKKAQEILIDDLPWIYLVQPGYQAGLSEKMNSVTWITSNGLDFAGFR